MFEASSLSQSATATAELYVRGFVHLIDLICAAGGGRRAYLAGAEKLRVGGWMRWARLDEGSALRAMRELGRKLFVIVMGCLCKANCN